MNFGETLKKYRLTANMTQTELAEKLGILQNNIHRWETNKIIPTIDTLKKLALILNVSADDLLFSKKEKEKINKGNKQFLSKLNDLDSLDPEDKETIMRLIDTLKTKASIKPKSKK